MLVLTRRIGERIVIRTADGEVIEVVVLDHDYGRKSTRLGITAPPHITIMRSEIDAKVHPQPDPEPPEAA